MPTPNSTLLYNLDGSLWTPQAAQPSEHQLFANPVPYALPDVYRNGSLRGVEALDDAIRGGAAYLYDKGNFDGAKIYVNGDGSNYLRVFDDANVDMANAGYREVPYDEFRRLLPKRDYIGGDTDAARLKAVQRIPGFTEKVYERAKAYGIDPNLMLHRIMKEGFIDQMIDNYNHLDASEQNADWWRNLWDMAYSGYGSFGLDYAGDELNAGYYELLDPDSSWHEYNWSDKEGGSPRSGTSVEAPLKSMLDIKAAALAYRQKLMKSKYNPSGSELGIYTNAAYNMGHGHKDLNNADYVRRNYSYPDYYTKYGLKYSDGGKVLVGKERIADLARRISEGGYEYAGGGKIHIKPSNRERLTELKERTGKTEAEIFATGTPAQRKMVTFARNARKWNHAEGGSLLYSYDGESEPTGQVMRVDSDGNLIDDIEPSVVTAKLPAKFHGSQAAARRYAEGYQFGKKVAQGRDKTAPYVGGALASAFALPVAIEAGVAAAPYVADGLGHVMGVMANPVQANTTAGALAATAADAYGLVSGAAGLGDKVTKAATGNYTLSDIPETLLDATVLVPGSSALTKTGNLNAAVQTARGATSYPRGVANRAAEAVIRLGDNARIPSKVREQLLNEKTLRYVFNPNADPILAYNLPGQYSGEQAVLMGAHPGDIVDQFLGKVPVPNASYDLSVLPENFQTYIQKNYPGKRIPIVDLGEAHSPFRYDSALNPGMNDVDMAHLIEDLSNLGPVRTGARSGAVRVAGKPVLDPGGFDFTATRTNTGFDVDAYDIWKFKPGEYAKTYLRPTELLQRIGLGFIDKQGTPIVHHWHQTTPTLLGH